MARNKNRSWLYGQFAYISAHAVGVMIKRSLHDDLGFYSNKFPIAADQLFIMECVALGASTSRHSFVAGSFDAASGTSGRDVLGSLVEVFRVQVLLGQSLSIQLILLLLRIIRFKSRLF